MRKFREHEDESELLDIALSVSDGAEVDWDTLESSAPGRHRPFIRQLRLISQVAGSHLAGLHEIDVTDSVSLPSTWGSLEVIEPIGSGAFGEVFLARDSQLEREVALKFFHPDRDGFNRRTSDLIAEGRLLARVHHPNVVTIFGAEHHQGRAGIWMERVRGATLEAIITERGPLESHEAIRIGQDVCRGLAALHEAGIVHRDIKAKNIMCQEDGRVVLMDLGVGCEVDSQIPVKQYGTPLYAAPEVLIQAESTYQSDIYSVGVLLFHMVTGDYPVLGRTPDDLRQKHQKHSVRRLRDLRPDLPDAFIEIVERALAPDPDQRFATAHTLEQALTNALVDEKQDIVSPVRAVSQLRPLKIFLITSVVALLAALIGYFFLNRHDSGSSVFPEDRIMLAVLPFENLGTPKYAYFADGITNEILTSLSTIPELGVIARESAFKFRSNEHTVEEIGRQLGVDFILKGAIRWQLSDDGSSRIRVTPRLVSVAENRNIWAETYEEPLDQIFVVQASIGTMIAKALNITLRETSRQALDAIPTRNLEAYDYYIRAKEMWLNTTSPPEEYPVTEELFQKAIELDPRFAQAYALLGMVHGDSYDFNIDRSPQRLEKLKSAFEAALDLNPAIPEAYLAKSRYLYITQADLEEMEETFEKACSLRPNDWLIIFYKGIFCKHMGLYEEAIGWLRQAQVLDPANPSPLVEEAICYTNARKYAESERVCRHMMSLWPDHTFPYKHLTAVFVIRDGDPEMAKQVLNSASGVVEEWRLLEHWQWIYFLERDYEKALETTDDYSDEYMSGIFKNLARAELYHYLGRHDETMASADSARVILEEKVQEQPDDHLWHLHLGRAYAFLNRKEEAIREVQIASELMPVSKSAITGANVLYSCAAVYAFVGENDAALENLEYLLEAPTYTTKKRLVIDPLWDPLRNHPRFQQLVN